MVRVKISELNVTCDVGGNALSALFPGSINQEITIAPYSTLATDCPLYCGGISVSNQSSIYSGSLEVYGLYKGKDNSDYPEKINTPITVQNY